MKISRDGSTPLSIGAFALLSLTFILMYFHLDTGLHKVARQWLSKLLIADVGLPVSSNLPAFKRYLAQTRARGLIRRRAGAAGGNLPADRGCLR